MSGNVYKFSTWKQDFTLTCHYEEDPEKAAQAQEAFERGLCYIAEQGGWLDVLDRKDAAMERLKQLSVELSAIRAEF